MHIPTGLYPNLPKSIGFLTWNTIGDMMINARIQIMQQNKIILQVEMGAFCFFISFLNCAWTTHFVLVFFSIVQNIFDFVRSQTYRLFSYISFVFSLKDCLVISFSSFSKVCSNKIVLSVHKTVKK